MARLTRYCVTKPVGKTVKLIQYEENPDCQALELAFSDDTLVQFEGHAGSRALVVQLALNTDPPRGHQGAA